MVIMEEMPEGPTGLAFARDGALLVLDGQYSILFVVGRDGELRATHRLPEAVTGRLYSHQRRAGSPRAVLELEAGAFLVAETGHDVIRLWNPPAPPEVLAGRWDEPGIQGGRLNGPVALARHPDGTVLVAEAGNTIRRLWLDGRHELVAGYPGEEDLVDGKGSDARFWAPSAMDVSPEGITFVADSKNRAVRTLDCEGVVRTLAGGALGEPSGIKILPGGDLLVSDRDAYAIHRVGRATGTLTTVRVFEASAGARPPLVSRLGDGPSYTAIPGPLVLAPEGVAYFVNELAQTVESLGVDGTDWAVVCDLGSLRLAAGG